MGGASSTPSDSDQPKRQFRISMKLINEEEYKKLKNEQNSTATHQADQERERNLLVLMSLRPEFFELEDQIKFEQI